MTRRDLLGRLGALLGSAAIFGRVAAKEPEKRNPVYTRGVFENRIITESAWEAAAANGPIRAVRCTITHRGGIQIPGGSFFDSCVFDAPHRIVLLGSDTTILHCRFELPPHLPVGQ